MGRERKKNLKIHMETEKTPDPEKRRYAWNITISDSRAAAEQDVYLNGTQLNGTWQRTRTCLLIICAFCTMSVHFISAFNYLFVHFLNCKSGVYMPQAEIFNSCLIFDKYAQNTHHGKDSIFNTWCRMSAWRRMKLDTYQCI